MKLFGWIARFANKEYKERNQLLADVVSQLTITNKALGDLAISKNREIRKAAAIVNAILLKAGGKVTLSKNEVDAGVVLPVYRMEPVENGVLVRVAHANEGDE